MKVELENVKPMDIEKRSFEIITEELGDKKLVPGTELIVKRCIHTSADFDYAENLCFSENAVEKAIAAIKDGACIVTDTHMASPGSTRESFSRYGGEVFCFISDRGRSCHSQSQRNHKSYSQAWIRLLPWERS